MGAVLRFPVPTICRDGSRTSTSAYAGARRSDGAIAVSDDELLHVYHDTSLHCLKCDLVSTVYLHAVQYAVAVPLDADLFQRSARHGDPVGDIDIESLDGRGSSDR